MRIVISLLGAKLRMTGDWIGTVELSYTFTVSVADCTRLVILCVSYERNTFSPM
jgi:hypothetical protein